MIAKEEDLLKGLEVLEKGIRERLKSKSEPLWTKANQPINPFTPIGLLAVSGAVIFVCVIALIEVLVLW